MNRIRQSNGVYQVLITPSIKIAPDSALMVGNWDDENLRNYYVLEFQTLNDAQCEAFKHPDIDWHRLIINHEHIFYRLRSKIRSILDEFNFDVEFNSHLMSSETLKNAMFDRVLNGGERFNLRYNMTDIISFTITNPWSSILHKVAKSLELHRGHLYLDELRIRDKKIVDGKIICLYGITELGTIYEIKLLPTILQQWANWMNRYGFRQPEKGEQLYRQMLETQKRIDRTPAIR